MSTPEVVVTLSWFKKEDWPRLPQVMPDVWDTYEEWLSHAEVGYKKACADFGEKSVHKMIVRLDDFIQWARANNKSQDARGRSEYAAWLYAKGISRH